MDTLEGHAIVHVLQKLVRFTRAVMRGLDASTRIKPNLPGDDTPLRIGVFHPYFTGSDTEDVIIHIIKTLQRRGVRVVVLTSHRGASLDFEDVTNDSDIALAVRVYGDWLPCTLGFQFAALCASMRSLFVTLMTYLRHTNDVDAFIVDQVSICVPFLRALDKPVLFYGRSIHELGSRTDPAYRSPFNWLEQITLASADQLVVNSKFTHTIYKNEYHRVKTRKLSVLYPPVDVEEFAKFKPSEPRNPHMFVSLNRFERKKNVALAIRALIKMQTTLSADEFHNIKLIVAGGYDPNNRENIEHLNELKQLVGEHDGLADHVEFRTSVSDEMKKTLLATARAVLYTPSNEHFGIVPVEAMTYGTPVIAVNSGGPLESVAHGETGFLCDSTPEAFAAAMMQLVGHENDGRAAEMGERGRARARELFSLKTFGDTLMGFVERLVR